MAISLHSGDSEIHQLNLAAAGQHDIGGLDVAVNDTVGVRVAQRIQHLRGVSGSSARRQRAALQHLR